MLRVDPFDLALHLAVTGLPRRKGVDQRDRLILGADCGALHGERAARKACAGAGPLNSGKGLRESTMILSPHLGQRNA